MIELTDIEKEKILACIEYAITTYELDILRTEVRLDKTKDKLDKDILSRKLEKIKDLPKVYTKLKNKLKLYFEQD